MSMNTKSSVEPAESYLDVLDENLMRETFELAHQDYLDGHSVSNSQVVDYIKESWDGSNLVSNVFKALSRCYSDRCDSPSKAVS